MCISVYEYLYLSLNLNISIHMGVSINRCTPKSSRFHGIFPYKPSMWEYPYFRKPPYLYPCIPICYYIILYLYLSPSIYFEISLYYKYLIYFDIYTYIEICEQPFVHCFIHLFNSHKSQHFHHNLSTVS